MSLMSRAAPAIGWSIGAMIVLRAWRRSRNTGFAAFADCHSAPGGRLALGSGAPSALRDQP